MAAVATSAREIATPADAATVACGGNCKGDRDVGSCSNGGKAAAATMAALI